MHTKIKLCGIRRPEDIAMVNAAGPDYVGFVFAESRRQVTETQAAELGAQLEREIRRVGVFVNEPISSLLEKATAAELDVIQLHGEEDMIYVRTLRKVWRKEIWKAVRVRMPSDIAKAGRMPVDSLLFDAYQPDSHGGTGVEANISFIAQHRPIQPFFLAGGLNCENMQEKIQTLHPDGVDISSGIETNGYKDAEKIQNICKLIRGIE